MQFVRTVDKTAFALEGQAGSLPLQIHVPVNVCATYARQYVQWCERVASARQTIDHG